MQPIPRNAEIADALPSITDLLAELARCGWSEAGAARRWSIQTPQGPREAAVRLMRGEVGAGEGEAELAVLHLPEWTAPDPGELFRHILDLPMPTRLALDGARRLLGARWMLLLSAGAMELFRLPSEALLRRAASGWEVEREMMPALAALARRGEVDGVAAGLPHGGADALAGWLKQWTTMLAGALEARPAAIERMLWKWIVMLQVARRADHAYDREQWGIAMERLGDIWELSYDPRSAAVQLRGNLERFDQIFATRIFDGETAQQCEWIERLDEGSLLEQLRAELLMQSQQHFEAETVAWLFTDLEREQAGWRREVSGAEPIAARLKHDGWNIFEPLRADVAAFGLGAALRDADRLAQYWHDLDRYFGRRAESESETASIQPDLFCGAPRGVDARGRIEDGLNFLYGESLRLAGVSHDERLGVGVVFLLKAVALNQALGWPLRGLDTLDRLLER